MDSKYNALILYVETCYEAIGKPLPRKEDGSIDVLRCKAFLLQMAHGGMVQPFDKWHFEMYGEYPDGSDGFKWPDSSVMPWPPFRALDAGLESVYGG